MNFDLLVNTIQEIPPVRKMLELGREPGPQASRRLRAALDKLTSPLTFPLLSWILSSNRAHLEAIPAGDSMAGLGPHQFLLVSATPAKEGRFKRARQEAAQRRGASPTGSFFVWHGSSAGNWHCILRQGLRSGTHYMSAGAAYGKGIYTARGSDMSLGYSGQPSTPWRHAELLGTAGLRLLSLCEVVDAQRNNSDTVGKPTLREPNPDMVTIQNEDLIVTRFLFALSGGHPSNIQANQVAIPPNLLL